MKTIRDFGLLTGRSEPILDRITALAATFFNVPIAVISVIDDTHSNVLSGFREDAAGVIFLQRNHRPR